MYTDGNPCEFFSSHFLVKTCQDLRMEHHRRAHLSTFVQSQQSGYPFWKCGWKFMIYPLRNWKYQGYAPPFNHQSWTCKTMKKKTNLVQDSQDKLQGIYTFDIHGFAPPIPIFSHHFPVFSPLHRNHFLVHPIFERPTSSHHLTRLQRKPQTGISRWGNDGQLYPPLKLPQPQYK